VVLGGLGTLLVAGLWLRLFPALAQRDALVGIQRDSPEASQRDATVANGK
jgi:hypothetical protein